MLAAEVLGLKYHRIIVESVNPSTTAQFKQQFDYSFVVSFGDFSDEDYDVVGKYSCILDLTKGLDHIIAGFSSTSRNEFRRSERTEGLKFMQGYSDFDTYYRFYSACEHDREWLPVPPDELKNSLVFSASFHDEYISGMSCYHHNKRLRVGRIYSTKRSKRSEVLNNTLYGSAAKRIVVEICRYGIEQGFETLDLGGIDPGDQNKFGISQFKMSLGGVPTPVKLGRFMKESFRSELEAIKNCGWDIT